MSMAMEEQTALHRLIYFSRAQPETTAKMKTVFREILDVAQRLNARAGLTGSLLACDGWFMQILEGPRGKLLAAFERIKNDRRHGAIQIIHAGPTADRRFSRWTMCGRQLSATDDAVIAVLEKDKLFDPRKLATGRALSMLEAIQKLQGKDGDDIVEID